MHGSILMMTPWPSAEWAWNACCWFLKFCYNCYRDYTWLDHQVATPLLVAGATPWQVKLTLQDHVSGLILTFGCQGALCFYPLACAHTPPHGLFQLMHVVWWPRCQWQASNGFQSGKKLFQHSQLCHWGEFCHVSISAQWQLRWYDQNFCGPFLRAMLSIRVQVSTWAMADDREDKSTHKSITNFVPWKFGMCDIWEVQKFCALAQEYCLLPYLIWWHVWTELMSFSFSFTTVRGPTAEMPILSSKWCVMCEPSHNLRLRDTESKLGQLSEHNFLYTCLTETATILP